MAATRLRTAELAAAFSVVTDAARGLEEGQGIRSCVLAMHLAEHLQFPHEDRAAVFWVGLLRYAGWTAGSAQTATSLDADVSNSAALELTGAASRTALWSAAVRAVGPRPRKAADFVRRAPAVFAAQRLASSQVSQVIAARFGVPARVVRAVGQVFERWDGTGEPGRLHGTEIDKAVRLWQVAHTGDLLAAGGAGRREVPAALRRRAGRSLDPEYARALASVAGVLPVGAAAGVEQLLAVEPEPHMVTDQAGVDTVLPVFGVVADLSASYLDGHSDRVARLAADAARAAGLPPHDVSLLRRAGWVHDVGRVAVSPRVWTPARPLTAAEQAQAHAHAEHSRRLLAHTPRLAGLAAVVAAHHERLDGSGQPNGPDAAALSRSAALLAAADAYVSAGEPRPHRPARPPAEQAFLLLGLARDGRLPHAAVDAVIAAVNGAAPR